LSEEKKKPPKGPDVVPNGEKPADNREEKTFPLRLSEKEKKQNEEKREEKKRDWNPSLD